jgi:hypothetical protein
MFELCFTSVISDIATTNQLLVDLHCIAAIREKFKYYKENTLFYNKGRRSQTECPVIKIVIWLNFGEVACHFLCDRICGVMVSMFTSSVIDRGFEPRSVKPKTKILVFVASPRKNTALRRKSKDWLARIRIIEWGDMFICGL